MSTMSTTTASFLVGVTTGMTTALRSLAAMNQTDMSDQVNVNDTEDERRKVFDGYALTQVTYYMVLYNLWVILALGLPGNVASIFTIMSMPVVSSSKAHVAILAVTDSLAIIMKVAYLELSGSSVQLTVPGCALIMFINEFCTVYANWVVVAMTAERVLAVCFPLRVGRMYTRRKALIVLACLAVVTASVYLFHFWAWAEHHDPAYGYWYELKPEYQDFLQGAFYYISGCLYVLLPCVFVLAGNTLIIINIKRARQAQRHLTNAFDQGGRKARDQRQITVMLIVVSIVFLILNIPNAIFYFAKNNWTHEQYSYDHAKQHFTSRFIHMLSDANHAVNFYLYFLSMSTFRRRFLDAIRCRGRTRRRPAGSSVYRTSQTYLHSLQQTGDTVRPDGTGYSAFKRSSNHVDSSHSLRSYGGGSNNNKLSKSSSSAHEGQNCITASSNV